MPQRESSLAPGDRRRGGDVLVPDAPVVAQPEAQVPMMSAADAAAALHIPLLHRAAALTPLGFLSLTMLFGCEMGSTFGRGVVGDLTHCVASMPVAVPVCVGLSATAFLALAAYSSGVLRGRIFAALGGFLRHRGAQVSLASLTVCCVALAALNEGGEVPAACLAALAVAAVVFGLVKGVRISSSISSSLGLPSQADAAPVASASPAKQAASRGAASAATAAAPESDAEEVDAAAEAAAAAAAAAAEEERLEAAAAAADAARLAPFDAYLAAYGRQIERIVRRMCDSGSMWAASEEDVTAEMGNWLAAHPLTRQQVADARQRRIDRDDAFEEVWNQQMAHFDELLAEARQDEARATITQALRSRRFVVEPPAPVAAVPLSTSALTQRFRCKAAASEKSVGVVTHQDGSVAYAGQVSMDVASGRLRPHGKGAFYLPRACSTDTLASAHPSLVGIWQNGVPDAASDFKVFLVRPHAHTNGADIGYTVGTAKFTGKALASLDVQEADALESGPLDPSLTLPWCL